MTPSDFDLPLTPAAFHILLALAAGEKHGYAIMQDVTALSAGQVHLGPGSLYGTIKRLLTDGWIAEAGERASEGDERRRYYRLTELGQRIVRAEAQRLAHLVDQARARRLLPRTSGAMDL